MTAEGSIGAARDAVAGSLHRLARRGYPGTRWIVERREGDEGPRVAPGRGRFGRQIPGQQPRARSLGVRCGLRGARSAHDDAPMAACSIRRRSRRQVGHCRAASCVVPRRGRRATSSLIARSISSTRRCRAADRPHRPAGAARTGCRIVAVLVARAKSRARVRVLTRAARRCRSAARRDRRRQLARRSVRPVRATRARARRQVGGSVRCSSRMCSGRRRTRPALTADQAAPITWRHDQQRTSPLRALGFPGWASARGPIAALPQHPVYERLVGMFVAELAGVRPAEIAPS